MAPWIGALKGAYLRGPLPRPPPDGLPVVLTPVILFGIRRKLASPHNDCISNARYLRYIDSVASILWSFPSRNCSSSSTFQARALVRAL